MLQAGGREEAHVGVAWQLSVTAARRTRRTLGKGRRQRLAVGLGLLGRGAYRQRACQLRLQHLPLVPLPQLLLVQARLLQLLLAQVRRQRWAECGAVGCVATPIACILVAAWVAGADSVCGPPPRGLQLPQAASAARPWVCAARACAQAQHF